MLNEPLSGSLARISISMLSLLILVFSAIFAAGCTKQQVSQYVSVHQLRVNPGKYENSRVIVKGYLARFPGFDAGRPFLYATKDDAGIVNLPAGVPVSFDISGERYSSCYQRYVQITGTFAASLDDGGYEIYEIVDIEYITSALLKAADKSGCYNLKVK